MIGRIMKWAAPLLVGSALAMSGLQAFAETATLYPAKDNTIYAGGPFENNSCGAGTGMIAGNTNNGLARRGLVMFDVASVIPPGAIVTSVSVTMTVDRDRADAQSTALHAVLTDWGEGTSDCDASAGQGIPAVAPDATWLAAMFPDTPWGAAGGDYSGAASATTLVTSGDPAVWASTPALVSDVQGWVDGSANNGWIIIGNEGANQTAYRFGTRESGNPPALTVEFDCPGGPGTCEPCCEGGVGSFVPPGTCAGFNPGGTTLTPESCVVDPGACCIPNADSNFTCDELLPADCSAAGGTFQGAGTRCRDTNICGLEPWQDTLPSPAVLAPVGTRADGVPQYEVTMTQLKQNLHSDLPDTTVWGYNGSFPGPTIAATVGDPIEVKYINDLRDFEGNLLDTHFLAVDQCAHGPNYWRNSPRTVVHLHGGHVPSRFDGQPEYDFMPGAFDTYEYPNNQLPATMWYHDHALGITRLNVIMGLAGFYTLSPDCDATTDPECNGSLPSGDYDVPIVIQDRDFNLNTGDFEYPDALQQAFHGNNILVNGKVWPTLKVDRGKYRFRILNGSTTRTYTLSFRNITTGVTLPISVIGTEGGFYAAPRPAPSNEVTLAPAERFEIIVDFEGQARRDEIIIKNSAVTDFPEGNPPTSGTQNVLKLEVAGRGFTGAVPTSLRPFTPITAIPSATRWFNLERVTEACAGGEWLVQTLDGPNGNVIGEHWDDITEYPTLGGTEIWEFKNNTAIMHPMHVHLVLFQVLERQALDTNGNPTGPLLPPDPLEVDAWKETVQAKPGTVTRVIMTFEDYLGKFPYHCHIIEHEDHEMMRQFQVTNDPANCNNNDSCDLGEDCISCGDCGTVPGNSCGNGLCEIGDGESSDTCPGDCAPGCGVGGVGCADAACTSTGFFCRQTARVPACCGDSLCEGQETVGNCAIDCAPAGQQCTYADPTVNISPTAQDITVDGGNVHYTVNIINNDSAACMSTTFNLTVDDSDNGADFVVPSTLVENSVMLGPAESGNVILTVTAQSGGTGSNDTSVIASDPANHADVTSNMVTTTINLDGPPPVDCGEFTDRTSCRNEPTGSCRWINKDNVCINR